MVCGFKGICRSSNPGFYSIQIRPTHLAVMASPLELPPNQPHQRRQGKDAPYDNKRIVLESRPLGEPSPEDFRLENAELREAAEGDVTVRIVYLSLDPYMRGRMTVRRTHRCC